MIDLDATVCASDVPGTLDVVEFVIDFVTFEDSTCESDHSIYLAPYTNWVELETTCHTWWSLDCDSVSDWVTTLSGLRMTKSNVVVETTFSIRFEPGVSYFPVLFY